MQVTVEQPELEQFIHDQVRSGRFHSDVDVVANALLLLKVMGQETTGDDPELNALLTAGLDESRRGLSTPWDTAEIERLVEERFEKAEHR